jgi:Ca-activated chloride channel family protein
MEKNLLVVFLLICGFINAQESYNSLVYEGNTAFNSKNYERASSKFSEAAKTKDKDFTSHYNLGNALYKRKMYDEARAEFQKAENFATTLPDKMAAQYNIGNTFMETQKPDKAAEYYKKALKQDPLNESAQRNYQIAKLKEKEQKGNNGNDKNKKPDENNIPKNLEKSILDRTSNKERETAQRILNKNANTMPQSNAKDW